MKEEKVKKIKKVRKIKDDSDTESKNEIKKIVKKEKEDCSICSNKYNNTFRKELKCPFCPWICCNMCCRSYILSKANPQCMECKTVWTDDFLFSVFPKSWVDNELRHHLDDVVVQQEKSLFPLAVEHIEKNKMENERRQLQFLRNRLESKLDRINQMIIKLDNSIKINKPGDKDHNHRKYFNDKIDLQEKIIEQKQVEEEYNQVLLLETELSDKLGKTIITRFRRPCPDFNCKGYIDLSKNDKESELNNCNNLECGICNKKFCGRCREVINTNYSHSCDESIIKTLKLLDKDTKPCPSCKVLVFKIDGCNQMFCTNCHSAFNWETGEIETGRIHNPHYFDYLKSNNNTNNNNNNNNNNNTIVNDCGRVVEFDVSNIVSLISKRYLLTEEDMKNEENGMISFIDPNSLKKYIYSLYRIIGHLRTVEMPELKNPIVRHLNSRVEFILNNIDEKKWKEEISLEERLYKKKFMWIQIVEMLVTVLNDLMNKFLNDESVFNFVEIDEQTNLFNMVPDVMIEVNNIRKYFNEISRKYSLRFNLNNYKFLTSDLNMTVKPTVKEELKIENYVELYKNNLEVLDWMDEVEKRVCNNLIEITSSINGFNSEFQILESEIENLIFNKNQLQSINKCRDYLRYIFKPNYNYIVEIETVLKIRQKRKIRNDIIVHGLNLFNKNIQMLIMKMYTSVLLYSRLNLEKLILDVPNSIFHTIKISFHFYPLYTFFIYSTKYNKNTSYFLSQYLNYVNKIIMNTLHQTSSEEKNNQRSNINTGLFYVCRYVNVATDKKMKEREINFTVVELILMGFIDIMKEMEKEEKKNNEVYLFLINILFSNIGRIRHSSLFSRSIHPLISKEFEKLNDKIKDNIDSTEDGINYQYERFKKWLDFDF